MPDREQRGLRRDQLRAFDAKSLWRCGESYPRPSRHASENTKYASQLRPPGGRHHKFGNSRRRLFRQAAQIIADNLSVRIDQSGEAAVSAWLARAATTFCIMTINRFCSAVLRPASVS